MVTALSSTTQSQPATPAAPSPSFLARCREDLSPDKPISLDRWSNAYSYVFLGGGTVLYITAAITAFVAVSILFPVYAPMAALTALVLAIPATGLAKQLKQTSDKFAQEANNCRAIQSHYTQISGQSLQQTQVDLMSRGIVWYQIPNIDIFHPENLASLHPVLARAKFLEDTIQKHLSRKNSLIAQARELTNDGSAPTHNTYYGLRLGALCSEDNMIDAKVKAAFTHAVLRKGDFNGTIEDIASVSTSTFLERAIDQRLNDTPRANHCLTFKNRNLAPITFDEMRTMDIPLLGHRLAAAMA